MSLSIIVSEIWPIFGMLKNWKIEPFKLLSQNLAGSLFILIQWIVPKIGIPGLIMTNLQPFLHLEKCQKLDRLILSNIFENEHFWIKNSQNMPIFSNK